jgi:hypothetical protein
MEAEQEAGCGHCGPIVHVYGAHYGLCPKAGQVVEWRSWEWVVGEYGENRRMAEQCVILDGDEQRLAWERAMRGEWANNG